MDSWPSSYAGNPLKLEPELLPLTAHQMQELFTSGLLNLLCGAGNFLKIWSSMRATLNSIHKMKNE
jgi:hypothetical protein